MVVLRYALYDYLKIYYFITYTIHVQAAYQRNVFYPFVIDVVLLPFESVPLFV